MPKKEKKKKKEREIDNDEVKLSSSSICFSFPRKVHGARARIKKKVNMSVCRIHGSRLE